MSPIRGITLVPLSEVSQEPQAAAAPAPSAAKKTKVLIVDDERLVADTLRLVFAMAGFDAQVAYDARTALTLAHTTPPDILVSDVDMPGMNGVELALALMEQNPLCPVLLISGHATWAQLAPLRDAGYDFPLLPKPVHPTEILRNVSKCLEGSGVRAAVQTQAILDMRVHSDAA